jgi:signal transduction histidine kinase
MKAQSKTRVLLIDDDKEDYEIIRDLFNDIPGSNFTLDWEPGFEAAKEQVKNQAHDIYLVDYRLGEKTGLDLFQEMRAIGCKKPMIVLTGYADQSIDQAAMQAGAADYLVKAQVTPHLLERSIRYAIHRTEMENQILVQDRLASIGLLTSGLAHDIGTPLGVVRGRAEYVTMQLAEFLNSKASSTADIGNSIQKNLNIIIAEIDRISNMIKSMLGFARGDSSERAGTVSIDQAISDVSGLLQHEFQKRGIKIDNQLTANNPILVRGESEKFQQVLMNLLINSVHAIDTAIARGRTSNHFIRIETEEDRGFCTLYIQDSGCGIPDENLARLFTPFFTTKEQGKGTGLGLVMAGWLIQLWGGKISVESQENVGTRFRIQLKKADA